MKIRLPLVIVLLPLSCIILCADPSQRQEKISIRDCLVRALKYNLDIKVEKFNPQIAQQDVIITKSVFDPTFSTNFIYDDSTTEEVQQVQLNNIFIEDIFEKHTKTLYYSGGVSKSHELGGSIGIFYNAIYEKNEFDDDGNQSVFSYEAEIQLTQSLLRNFGVDANTASINIAKNNLQSAKYQKAAKVLQILAEVQLAYLDLVKATENLRLHQESLELSQGLYRITNARVKVGTAPAVDLLDAERDIAEKRDNLVVAEKNIFDAEDHIKKLIQPLDADYYEGARLVPADRPRVRKNKVVFKDALKYALDRRMDIKQNRNNLQNADIDIAFQENQLLPKLDLAMSIGLQGEDNEHPNAFEQLYELDQPSWAVQLSLEIPLGNRAAKSRHRKAILRKQQLLTEHQNLENNIMLELRNNIRILETSARRVLTAGKTRKIAARQIAVEKNKYRTGLISLFRLQNTEQSLTEASINQVNAIIEHQKAIVGLERAQWALAVWLERYDIRLPFRLED